VKPTESGAYAMLLHLPVKVNPKFPFFLTHLTQVHMGNLTQNFFCDSFGAIQKIRNLLNTKHCEPFQ
jgi:hypothetical protein